MKQRLRTILLSIIIFSSNAVLLSQETEYETINNVQYYSETESKGDNYIAERCVLDIYYPKKTENFATIIWFHGGGLTSGNKPLWTASP